MGDAKYVKLNPAKMGIRYRGTVQPKKQTLLTTALKLLKAEMGVRWDELIAAKEIFWLNVWQQEEDTLATDDVMIIPDQTIANKLDKWCRGAVRKYCERGAIIDGYGYIVNPVGSRAQAWHIDYTTDVASLWIPLTPFTEKNATQFVTMPKKTPKELLELVASNVDAVNIDAIAREANYLVVQQVVAKPMSVLYMGRGTIHRGIANTGPEDRIAFYVSVHFIRDYEQNYPYNDTSVYEPSVTMFDTTR